MDNCNVGITGCALCKEALAKMERMMSLGVTEKEFISWGQNPESIGFVITPDFTAHHKVAGWHISIGE